MSSRAINILPFKRLPARRDNEGRLLTEPQGWPVFAFLPVRTRIGTMRWLCWLEYHPLTGDFTLHR